VQLDGYIEAVIQRDVDEVGHCVRKPDLLRRWLRAYAAAAAGAVTQRHRPLM
jgi:hypothetical protein